MNGNDPVLDYDEDGIGRTKPLIQPEPLSRQRVVMGQLVFWVLCLLGVVYLVSHPEVVQAILGNLA